QSARSVLPNATETKIFISANGRALRHFFEMRGSVHADTEIRELAVAMFRLIKEEAPNIFADLDVLLEGDAEVIRVKHSKV
nr:FAD-dependent thymidylate synthase [bacterium]